MENNSDPHETQQTPPDIQSQTPITIPTPALHSPQHVPAWIVLVLLILLPPLAWYFMYKEKGYHVWFGYFLIITSGLLFAFLTIQLLLFVPQMYQLYQSLSIDVPIISIIFPIGFLLLVLAGFIVGIVLTKRAKRKGELSKHQLTLAIVLSLFIYIYIASIPLFLFISTINPIYKITSEF